MVCRAEHLPWPSQLAAKVAEPPTQEAARQLTEEPTKVSQEERRLPSQLAAVQGLLGEPSAQAGREPWGLPETGAQVPSPEVISQASHCPAQDELQQ